MVDATGSSKSTSQAGASGHKRLNPGRVFGVFGSVWGGSSGSCYDFLGEL